MMRRMSVMVFLIFISVFLGARLNVVKSLALGGSGNDEASDVKILEDGSVAISGYTDSSSGGIVSTHGQEDFLIVKLDSDLNLQWWKTFGGSKRDIAEAIALTADGGYLLAGLTESADGDVTNNKGIGDFWVIRLSTEGELIWERTLGGSGQDHAYDVLEKPSGNILVAGYTRSADGDVSCYDWGEDFWIVELDCEGNMVSQWVVGAYRSEDCAQRLYLGEDGSVYAVGYFAYRDCGISCNYVDNQMSILKISAAGEVEWFDQFGGQWFEDGFDIVAESDGGAIATGSQDAGVSLFSNGLGGRDFWVISVDDEGNELWSKNYGGSFTDVARCIVLTDDGNLIVAGQTTSNDIDVKENSGMNDAWIIELDSQGRIIDTVSFGGSRDDVVNSAYIEGNRIIFAGYSMSYQEGSAEKREKDLWLFEVAN
ncbi:hypothetical protein Q502_12410 [Mesotoga sp. Brook.08.YT.4.2.5.2.]|uniref:hypothetical protein n=1 Tax=unclassified Mesotoga TaxID=1184398 RepID=UPI000E2A86A9|nr:MULTISPECIES: hypothetical protein [unclassified Mesotoga]RDI90974.1 hypothetical protein Q502_12410 [Mesotoga sp. Brook.08.YT.4.2.5.2.]